MWLLEGNAVYRRGSAEVVAPEGSLVLCRPGATDFFQWDRHRRTRHAYFHFSFPDPPEDWQDWPLVRLPETDDILRPLFRHVLTWFGRGDAAQCRLVLATMLTAFCTGESAAGGMAQPPWPPAVEQVCAWVGEQLDADPAVPLSLPRLAEVACLTPEHLCRVFKSALGHGPMETVRLIRLDRAATLLTRSNYAVGEIAALCGFASPFHFSRRFKDAYGLSPTELRRRMQGGGLPPLPRLLHHSAVSTSISGRE